MGCGDQTYFWFDTWLGVDRHKDKFPILFGLDSNNHLKVADESISVRVDWNGIGIGKNNCNVPKVHSKFLFLKQ